MKRRFLVLTVLAVSLAACSPEGGGRPTATSTIPAATSTATPAAGDSERYCGDGVCDGPENANNCPEDCDSATAEASPAPTVEGEGVRPGDEPGTYWVTNPSSGVELYTMVLRPEDWDGEQLPTLVIIPGGTDPGSAIAEGEIAQLALERGFAVVAFDPEGRGQSGGEETYSGFTHQDGLATVIEFAADLPEVDVERMGMISFSYGVTLASGVLARYPELPIRFYVDWEGPADRNDTTLGCTPSPNYDWPPCEDDAAWAEREAVTFIAQIQVPYQRVQMANDHAQPDVSHAVRMVNAAVEGSAPWVRLNDYLPNETYDPDDPPAMFPNGGGISLEERLLNYAEELFNVAEAPASIPPVYVSIAGHIEDVPVYTNCDVYPDYREKLLQFAETIAQAGVAFNLQVDYEFFVGALECETDAMMESTEGQNVLDYLATHYGFEIDPHQEGGWEEEADRQHSKDNYADVRFFGERVVPSISDNVGGLVWDDAEQFARLSQGERGQLYPDFTWQPVALTLAVSYDHHLGDFSRDDVASGIWAPAGAGEDFWVHDPDGRVIYIGPGEHANWDASRPWQTTPEFVQTVSDQLEQGAIERGQMYTASIAVPQSVIFNLERHQELLALIDHLAPLVGTGRAEYVTYSQTVDIWRTEYGARPNIFFLEGVEPPP